MAAPVIASADTALPPGFGNADLTFNKPASTASGDLLLAHVTVKQGTSITPPSGWTTVDATTNGLVLDGLYTRVAGSSEPSTYVFGVVDTGSNRSVGAILRVTGADGTTPVNAHGQTGFTGDHAAADSPSVTTTAADCLIVLTHGGSDNPTTNTVPSGSTQQYFDQNSNSASVKGASATAAAAGATGAYTWDVTGFTLDYVLRTTAIAPAAAGGGTIGVSYFYRHLAGGGSF